MNFRQLLPLVIFGGGFSMIGAVLYGAWMLGRYRGREENVPGDITRVEERIYRRHPAGQIPAMSLRVRWKPATLKQSRKRRKVTPAW